MAGWSFLFVFSKRNAFSNPGEEQQPREEDNPRLREAFFWVRRPAQSREAARATRKAGGSRAPHAFPLQPEHSSGFAHPVSPANSLGAWVSGGLDKVLQGAPPGSLTPYTPSPLLFNRDYHFSSMGLRSKDDPKRAQSGEVG